MKKYFITGLIILLPVAITLIVIVFIVNLLTGPFIGIVSSFLSRFDLLQHKVLFFTADQITIAISQLLILCGIAIVTIALGAFAHWFFFKTLLSFSDKLLHKIPLVNKVYKTTQEIIKTLFDSDKNSFKQVVMVSFPHKGMWTLGLVSKASPKVCSDASGDLLTSVFVPTTPNPTTGFLLMCRKEDLIYVDMRPEDAIKYIVSCGVITPDTVAKQL